MKTGIINKIICIAAIIAAALSLNACGAPDYNSLADKVREGAELSSADRDAMLDYLDAATEAELPALREARTFADVERIERISAADYPFIDLFSSALLRDYPALSPDQTARLAEIRDKTLEAFKK